MKQVAILFAILLLVSSARAAPITFIHTGTGSGEINGNTFANAPFTITSTGDTANRDDFDHGFSIDHDSSQFDIQGVGVFQVTQATRTFVNNALEIVGYSRATTMGTDLFNGPTDASFAPWELLTSIGPVIGFGALVQFDLGINTDGGLLSFDTESEIPTTFQATVVPEPSTLALAALGAIGLLFAARRKRIASERRMD